MSVSTSSSALSDKLLEIKRRTGVCAVAALVLCNGSVVDIAACGPRRKNKCSQVTLEDVWHIASCGKAMTATLIARLVEKNIMSWDTKLADIYSSVHIQLADATLLQLLTHTSGICRDFSDIHLLRRRTGEEMQRHRSGLARKIVTKKPKYPVGKRFAYSNTGYIVAAVMAECVTGKSYENLMQEEVFDPLGMSTAAFGALEHDAANEQPWGHLRLPGGFHCPVSPRAYAANSQLFAPASTIFLSLRDWAKFAQAHVEQGRSGLLSQAGFDVLHTPVRNNYACGWVMGTSEKIAVGSISLEHSGGNPFWASWMGLIPEVNAAFLFAVNECGSKRSGQALSMLKEIFQKYVPENSKK